MQFCFHFAVKLPPATSIFQRRYTFVESINGFRPQKESFRTVYTSPKEYAKVYSSRILQGRLTPRFRPIFQLYGGIFIAIQCFLYYASFAPGSSVQGLQGSGSCARV